MKNTNYRRSLRCSPDPGGRETHSRRTLNESSPVHEILQQGACAGLISRGPQTTSPLPGGKGLYGLSYIDGRPVGRIIRMELPERCGGAIEVDRIYPEVRFGSVAPSSDRFANSTPFLSEVDMSSHERTGIHTRAAPEGAGENHWGTPCASGPHRRFTGPEAVFVSIFYACFAGQENRQVC